MSRRSAFVDLMSKNAGITQEEAEHVFDIYSKKRFGVATWGAHNGWRIVHGSFLEADAINAVLDRFPI